MTLLPIAPPMIRPIAAALSSRSARRTQSPSAITTQTAKPTSSQRPRSPWARSSPNATPGFQTLVSLKTGSTWIGPRSIRSKAPSSQALTDWSTMITAAARPKATQPLRFTCGSARLSAMGRVPPGDRVGVAEREVRIARVGAHLGQNAPRACALAPLGPQRLDSDTRDFRQAEGVLRPLTGGQHRLARAEHLGGVQAIKSLQEHGIGDPDARRSLERRADALVAPLDLQRTGNHADHGLDLCPALGLGFVAPGCRRLRNHPKRVGAGVGEAGRPRLLHGE